MKMNNEKSDQSSEELEAPLEAYVYVRSQPEKQLQNSIERSQPVCDDEMMSEAQNHLLELPGLSPERYSSIKRSRLTRFIDWLFRGEA